MKKSNVQQLPKETLQIIDIAINKAVEKALNIGKQTVKEEIENYYQHLENRLMAHTQLIWNIEKYDRDMEDIKKESKLSGNYKSKDIVFIPNGGVKLDADEILNAKILTIERKKKIDQDEINEIKDALEIIKEDDYYNIIIYKYFQKITIDKIAELIPCDITTVRRNNSRLLRQMMIKLYGANALMSYYKGKYKYPKNTCINYALFRCIFRWYNVFIIENLYQAVNPTRENCFFDENL